MHKKQGYILFLLFSILSVCSILISLYFARVIIYRKMSQQSIIQQRCMLLSTSSIALAQDVLIPHKESGETTQPPATNLTDEQKTLMQAYPCFDQAKTYNLVQNIDGLDAIITMIITSEQGKLNINSLYDFEKKKFFNDGPIGDRKKLCTWLFERIAKINGKPNLMESFEKFLQSSSSPLNDVLQLYSIPEFQEQFKDQLFLPLSETKEKKLYLTDIFTINTEQNTINPWLLSPSWHMLLDIQPNNKLTDQEIKKLFTSLKPESNWKNDWDVCVKTWYQKEYKDIPEEIKSILTTRYEANIFSLLLQTKIKDALFNIFAIVKMNTKQHLVHFDVVKMYQI